MSSIKKYGLVVLANSYLAVPIQPGSKSPSERGWQNLRMAPEDLARYPHHGIGVLLGQGDFPLSAIDIDITDAALSNKIVKWCQTNLGATCERVGKAPKTLLLYRAESPGWRKMASSCFVDHLGKKSRIEVLGDGQQFVAYGVHPETQQSYTWPTPRGGLDTVSADQLPVITTSQISHLFTFFEDSATALKLTKISDSTAQNQINNESRTGLSLDKVASLLAPLDPHDYDLWLKAGMGLHHEFHGTEDAEAAFELWHDWSSNAANYRDREDLKRRWDGFTIQRDSLVTLRWLQKASRVELLPRDNYPATEFGLVGRMVARHGGSLRYATDTDTWLTWIGTHWAPTDKYAVAQLTMETIGGISQEADAAFDDRERERLCKFWVHSQKAPCVHHVVDLMKGDPCVRSRLADFDADQTMLGVGNGVVDLTTGELLPVTPQHLITITTTTHYDPDAACPLFDRTLSEVFDGDAELITFFTRLIGYALLGKPQQHQILVLPYGGGANGKSTIINAVRDALGGHMKTAGVATFMNVTNGSSASGPREDILRLKGARLVCTTEPEEDSVLCEGLVKTLTGGEKIPARGVYSRSTTEVSPNWVTFIPTNHLPIIKSLGKGIWRRLIPIPFSRDFDAEGIQDTLRPTNLAKEHAGILAKLVREALAYQKDGWVVPNAVEMARATYRQASDPISEWLEDYCDIGENCADTNRNLWVSWKIYADANGLSKLVPNPMVLGRKLAGRFKAITNAYGIRGRGFFGIRIRQAGGEF